MKTSHLLSLLTLTLGCTTLHADVLELKNGTVLNGKYTGGTAGTVRFETSAGLQVIETSQAVALTFTTPAGGTTSAPTAPAAPAAQAKSVTLPAGTALVVRMVDQVSSGKPAGTRFTTKLEYDLTASGTVALKGGTTIYGKVKSSTQARRAVGKSTLDLRLTDLVVSGQLVPIVSSGFQEAGASSLKKAARGAAVGAAIGEIADDDAGKGAAIGATASLVKRGETVTVSAGALLEFTLSQPVTIQLAP